MAMHKLLVVTWDEKYMVVSIKLQSHMAEIVRKGQLK